MAPWATSSAAVMEHALAGVCRVLVVCFLLSAAWLSSLPGVRSYGGRHGPGSGLGLLGLFVLGCCFQVLNAEMIEQNLKPKTSPTDFLSPGPPLRGLTNRRE